MEFDPAEWKQIQFERLISQEDYAKTKDELVDIAKQMGGIDEETLSGNQFKPFVDACHEAGIEIDDLRGEINSLAGIEIFDQGEIQRQLIGTI